MGLRSLPRILSFGIEQVMLLVERHVPELCQVRVELTSAHITGWLHTCIVPIRIQRRTFHPALSHCERDPGGPLKRPPPRGRGFE